MEKLKNNLRFKISDEDYLGYSEITFGMKNKIGHREIYQAGITALREKAAKRDRKRKEPE